MHAALRATKKRSTRCQMCGIFFFSYDWKYTSFFFRSLIKITFKHVRCRLKVMLPVQNHKHTPAHPEGFTVTFKMSVLITHWKGHVWKWHWLHWLSSKHILISNVSFFFLPRVSPEQGPVVGSVGARKKPSLQGQSTAPCFSVSVLAGHGSHASLDASALKEPGRHSAETKTTFA